MESETHYNYFRGYDPAIGRYVQSDPIGLRGGPNSFSYVLGKPLTLVDPRGLMGQGSGKPNPNFSFNVGAGGSFHYGSGGAGGESGFAIDNRGRMCFYTQTCWTVGFGLAGGLGFSFGAQSDSINTNRQDSSGYFVSGGAGVYGGGQGTQGDDGSAGASRGFFGVGKGGAAGRIWCSTRYYCWQPFPKPPSCQP